MDTTNGVAEVEVLKSYPEDHVWNVSLTFPTVLEGKKNNAKAAGTFEYALYQVQGWTDEPVDLNELRIAAISRDGEYKLLKGDNDSIPERVQSGMLVDARNAMNDAEDALNK